VELTGLASEVQLEVKDSGTGFDVEAAKQNRGLGLVSMQERVNLIQGRLLIESGNGTGTRIVATVPVVVSEESVSADTGHHKAVANRRGAA